MKALDVISVFDKLRPNSFDFGTKRGWVAVIEADIRNYDALHRHESPDMSFLQDDNFVLMLDKTYSDLYVYYLISMADMANGEFRMYNISSAYFNSLMDKWKRGHRGKNLPQKNTYIKY